MKPAAGHYVCVAASTLGDSPVWDRDRAAICGNMVRLYKLVHTVLDQTTQRRQEAAFIFARLVFETLVNIRYMIEHFEPQLIDEYVKYSLRHERKLRDRVLANIDARNGIMLPIEDRMLKSIERAATAAGVPLDDVDISQKGPWGGKNLFDKAEAVGLGGIYLGAFGGPSHGVHGNWHEIYSNHVEWDEESGFTPKLDWHHPRPQVLFGLSTLIIETLAIYFSFMCGEQWEAIFGEPLSDLSHRATLASNAHEAYLAGKQWPEI
ncbi:hypothetical protein CU103_03965 [Phyllobacterium sophorae]|uniref:Uncharacterized protein n=2 Tax=Phyllobacterium sophorae TaxID=1520277 RepID=A0A2P7BH56_9HYPH|nr:hypothetical protein CU103_03965 [Phyllobacterium sophorae]